MTTVIDLDARPADDPERPRPARHRRWWAAAILLVPLLVGGSGAAPARDPVAILAGDRISAVAGDVSTMYVMSAGILAAFRLPGGARAWSAPVPEGAHLVYTGATRVVVSVLNDPVLIGLDAGTGAEVWRKSGWIPAVHGCTCADGVVLAQHVAAAGTLDMAGLDPATGAARWSLEPPLGGAQRLVFTGDLRVQIAVLDAGGTLRLHRADTGAVVRTVTLESPGAVDGFALSGDRLLAYRTGDRATVFDLTTGRRLWEHKAAYLLWCGPMLCTGDEQGPTTVLDRDTGRELWKMDGPPSGVRLTGRYLMAPPGTDGIRILEPATGRQVARLDGWTPVGALDEPRLIVAGGPLLGVLDPATGRAKVLGRADAKADPQDCFITGALLVCRLDASRAGVWEVPA
ncbi:PQQ-binding-like beta-propeller repeat protein [Dactylosporangium sp. CS-047395]|uniref:outer membrane protein assembly factor BamB family protein n=1 Tax=Dactylosporangium sp. CS-047395 TaxID=3239936 RepID=UPI003D8A1E3C